MISKGECTTEEIIQLNRRLTTRTQTDTALLPASLSTATSRDSNLPRGIPSAAHAAKWFPMVMYPVFCGLWRILQYWLKLAPVSLMRWDSWMLYMDPSDVTVPCPSTRGLQTEWTC